VVGQTQPLSVSVATRLSERIRHEGPISVAAFMEEALGSYYATRDPLGARGDFTTAPEISQMFGELIGLWCTVVWESMGKPDRVALVELGPGRGTLMADALRAAGDETGFAGAARLYLVERSPVLRAKQKEALAAHAPTWHDDVSDVPPGPAIVVANEFFDALPVRQFERTLDGWCERLVDADPDGAFRFALSPPLATPEPIPARLRGAAMGSIVEVSPPALAVVEALAARFRNHGGAALIVDYGHAESAAGETLQAVKGHAFSDVLAAPGEADLTAHVDFGALRDAAKRIGAQTHGPVGQGVFLERLGIAARAESLLAHATVVQARDIRDAKARLIGADRMGTLFKAFAIGDPKLAALPGFG
jgi:NADH dehydrogenase [ubiquinone] 1 alpha subcomplex assembly factor 7